LNTRIVVTRYGGPEVMELMEEPLRSPGRGELRIKVESMGVALADVMRREGVYPMPPAPPFTPGYDAVGIVDEAGEDVPAYSPGDRVGVMYTGTGGYSAYVYEAADQVFPVPKTVDAAQASAVILNYVSAYQMLHRAAKVVEGENVLIHGASGGVGTALLELGRLAKVNLFGTASSARHDVVARYGATPIDYRQEDFVRVLGSAVPAGMDAVFDPIGGENWGRSFRTLGRNGRFVGYGFTSVLKDASDDWMSDWKAVAETKTTGHGHPAHLFSITSWRKENPGWFAKDVRTLLAMLELGTIDPLVSHRIPLPEAARAHELLERSESWGKVVLIAP
jgi:NADPH:quinone reductase-like Zn-dependent oxidoreductase